MLMTNQLYGYGQTENKVANNSMRTPFSYTETTFLLGICTKTANSRRQQLLSSTAIQQSKTKYADYLRKSLQHSSQMANQK